MRREIIPGVALIGFVAAVSIVLVSPHPSASQQDLAAGPGVVEPAAPSECADADPESLTPLVTALERKLEVLDYLVIAQRLVEYLPNQQFSFEGAEPRRLGEGVIEGCVMGVTRAMSFWDASGGPATEQAFDAQDAAWRAIFLEVAVLNDFDVSSDAPRTIEVGFTFSSTADEAAAILDGVLGQHLLLPVARSSDIYPFDDASYDVALAGGLVGLVDADGRITLPAMHPTAAARWLDGIETLDDLAADAILDKPLIQIENFERVA